MRISLLILDGDRWQRETLAAALSYHGYHTEHTGESASAMRMLEKHRFQLVLLHPSAPSTGGWDTVEQLVLNHPELPVVILAPRRPEESSSREQWLGAVSASPINFPVLVDAIAQALSPPAETYVVRCLDPARHQLTMPRETAPMPVLRG